MDERLLQTINGQHAKIILTGNRQYQGLIKLKTEPPAAILQPAGVTYLEIYDDKAGLVITTPDQVTCIELPHNRRTGQ